MSNRDFYIVGVGASAGGQAALGEFFSTIPPTINAAFVVVTHLFRDHKSELTSILSRFTKLKVTRIQKHSTVLPGNVYVMPEDVLVRIENRMLILSPRPHDNLINKSIDTFFESLAMDAGPKAIGVVLSGMGSDGSAGAVKIFLEGGDVLVQDPESTRFNSMPMATILKDHPDFILPPKQLGTKITELVDSRSIHQKERPARQQRDFRMNG